MKIIVEGHEIETKDIVKIKESPGGTHGFIITMVGPRYIEVFQKESYCDSNGEKASINDRYRKLRMKVEEYWNQDKSEIPILNL